MYAINLDTSEAPVFDHLTPHGAAPASCIVPETRNAIEVPMRYRRDIDGLRGLAVLMVVLFHTQTGIVLGGFIGVDAFFVLSGYLITTNLLREVEDTGSISLCTFYARRFKRLLPMSCLVLVFIVGAAAFTLPERDWTDLSEDIQSAALYYANIRFERRVTNYFDSQAANSHVMHYWSLSVEEQFYFVLPLVVVIIVAAHGHSTFLAGKEGSWRFSVLAVLVVAFLSSLLLDVWQTPKHRSTSYFNTSQRTWELLAGSLLSIWHTDPNANASAILVPIPLSFIAILTLLGLACTYNSDTIFPGTAAIGPVVCTVVILHAGRHGDLLGSSWVLASFPLVSLGKLSYSIYLWHWPILQHATRMAGVDTIEDMPGSWLCGSIVCTLVLSALSYALVERPCRQRASVSSGVVVAVGLACTLMVVALTLVVLHSTTDSSPKLIQQAPVDQAQAVGLQTFFSILPDPIHDPLTGDMGMLLPSGTKYNPAAPSVVLLGDSHARHWAASIHDAVMGAPLKAQFFQWALRACPPHFPGSWYQRGDERCVQVYDSIPSAFIEVGFVDAVILSSSVGFQAGYIRRRGIEAFSEQVTQFLHMLAQHTNVLIYIHDVPRFANFDSSMCGKSSNDARLGEVRMADVTAPIKREFLVLQRIFADFVTSNPRLSIRALDLADENLCNSGAGTCNWMEIADGIIVCRAEDAVGHLNTTWARTLAPRIHTALSAYVTRALPAQI